MQNFLTRRIRHSTLPANGSYLLSVHKQVQRSLVAAFRVTNTRAADAGQGHTDTGSGESINAGALS